MFYRSFLISVCVISVLSTNLYADAGFRGLGDLDEQDPSGRAYDISADGLIVVGNSHTQTFDDWVAFRWTDDDNMVDLGYLTGHNVSRSTHISGDGLTIIGDGYHYSVDDRDAQFIWTMATGMELLDVGGEVAAISFNGSVLAGKMDHATARNEAFRRSGGSNTGLGFLATPDSNSQSAVSDMSSDGSVIVGISFTPDLFVGFRWTMAGGMVSLGDLANNATAVSGTGDVIVGRIRGVNPYSVYIWTEATGVIALFDPEPDSYIDSRDISTDGKTVVGNMQPEHPSGGSGGRRGWRWTKASGRQTIKEWLTDASVDSTGWLFDSAVAVSSDGTVVTGTAINPSGDREPYIAWVVDDVISGGPGFSFENLEPK